MTFKDNMSIIDLLQFQFVQRAFIAGIIVAVTCAVLGVFLVLRKLSLIGDGLAHVSFGAVAIALMLGLTPMWVALPVVVLSAIGIHKLQKKASVYGDAAIGLVAVTGLAGGVLIASLSESGSVDLMSYLFGSILTISSLELIIASFVSLVVLLTIGNFYRDLFAVTFDPQYAQVIGVKVERMNVILMILTGLTVVLAIKVVGVLLVPALLIVPAVFALQIAKSFSQTLVLAIVFSVVAMITGLLISLALNWPAGATIVLTNVGLFTLSLLGNKLYK